MRSQEISPILIKPSESRENGVELRGLSHLLTQLTRASIDVPCLRSANTLSGDERRPQDKLQVELLLSPRRGLRERSEELQSHREVLDGFQIGRALAGEPP